MPDVTNEQENEVSVTNSGRQTDAWGESNVRTSGSMARRVFAGLFLAVAMTLALAGVASAQSSNSNSNSNSNTNTATSASSSSSRIGGSSTARTGIDTWIPLMIGGLGVTIAIATRVGLTRAASRIS